MDPLRVILCRDLTPYYESVAREYFPSLQVCSLPYHCLNPLVPGSEAAAVLPSEEIPDNGYLICGPMCPLSKILPDTEAFPILPPCRSRPLPLLSPGMVEEQDSQGALFVTSGSLPRLLAGAQEPKKTPNTQWKGKAARIVYISIDGECPPGLETLSKLTGLPHRIVTSDRDYIRLMLERIRTDWEMRKIRVLHEKDLKHFRKRSADYGAMLSVIGGLTRSDSEETVLTLLQETLRSIFDAGTIVWHDTGILNDPGESDMMTAAFRENPRRRYVLNPTNSGFWVRVEHSGNTLGFLEIGDFRFVEYQQSYLDFTMNICQVIGLSLANARTFEKLQKNEERFRHLSLHDTLTGVGNRFNINRAFKKACGEPGGGPYAILVCDIDGLKEINDRLGHAAGDQAIMSTAKILKKCLRNEDSLSRIGGDEFAAVIGRCSEAVIETIRTRIEQTIIKTNKNGEDPFSLDFSIGFCLAEGFPPDMQEAFRKADDRMYAAKRAKKLAIRQTSRKSPATP